MERSSRILSFVCLFFAALLCFVWLGMITVTGRLHKRILSSLVFMVYLDKTASDEDINAFRKKLDNYKQVRLILYEDSATIYDKLRKDPDLSEQMEILKDKVDLPPRFKIGINTPDYLKINNILEKLKKGKSVEHLDTRNSFVKKTAMMMEKIRRIRSLLGLLLPLFAFYIFSVSAYLFRVSQYDEIRIANNIAADVKVVLGAAARRFLLAGIISGIAARFLYYWFTAFCEIEQAGTLIEDSIIIIFTGILAVFFYRVIAVFRWDD
ncbi:MAG: permease-like cell division protein FtsX [Elusimicrobiota bacterium]